MQPCAVCKKPADKYLCTKCRAKRSEYGRKRRSGFKEKGLCIHCGKPAIKGQTRCDRCAARTKRVQTKIRRRKDREHECARCSSKRVRGSRFCRKHLTEKKELRKYRINENLCTLCGKMAGKDRVTCVSCREVKRKSKAKIKTQVIKYYGGKCACCGEKQQEFLTIDHIDGGGTAHRRKMGTGGSRFYNWLHKQNYPSGYRVLCFNCNAAEGLFGYCPHNK